MKDIFQQLLSLEEEVLILIDLLMNINEHISPTLVLFQTAPLGHYVNGTTPIPSL